MRSNYPSGAESMRRKVFASRGQVTTARFLTVVEPYEDKPMVKSAVARDAERLRVGLMAGRSMRSESET